MLQRIKKGWIAALLVCSVYLFSLGMSVAPVSAALIPSQLSHESSENHDLETVRQFLEHKMVQQQLKAFGVSDAEATQKLSQLSEKDIHTLATQIDTLVYAGAESAEQPKQSMVTYVVIVGMLMALLAFALVLSN